MRASEFIPGHISKVVKEEHQFSDYELAVMEGGNSLEQITRRSALREAVSIVEAFDKPYEILRWEKGDFGDIDAIARLDDNTFLSIMFNKGVSKDSKEEAWSVEFYRNNSQEVTGEGDAQRVFATVISAMQTFIKKYKPNRITFTASKEVEQGQNAQSRARLYDSLVQRYARSWGFRAFRADTGNKVIYELNRIKPVTEDDDLEEGWKDWVAGAALGAAALSPQAADAKSAPQQKPAITQQVQGDANYATKLILKPEAKILIQTARAAGMRGKELAQFVAQCAHETSNFSSLKEFGGRLDFKKYDPKHNPRKAKILGNKQVGDGAKYHGRGYIQLTGRDNYKRAGQALGLPLESQPELVEQPEVAAKVAVWFWQNQVAPKVNNFNDTAQVTKPINSGLKGLDDRHNKFASIMALMGSKS
jgi:predicted chitinase